MMLSPQHPPGMPRPSTYPYSPPPAYTSRKRRAASPELPSPTSPFLPQTASTSSWSSSSSTFPPTKRKRPNLANGFSGLSLHPRDPDAPPSPLPSYEESEATKNHVDENDGHDDTTGIFIKSPPPDDLQVEVLQDGLSSSLKGRSSYLGSGSDSDDELEEGRFGRGSGIGLGVGRRFGGVQQGEVVEGDEGIRGAEDDLDVEDITAQYQGVKRRGFDGVSGPGRKRRRNRVEGGMDVDMDMSGDEADTGRRRRRTQWHEPEKDRIVITSIGSPDSSASERSLSPDVEDKRLAQPGSQGFTLNPSLLTHLLSKRSDDAFLSQPKERGLVLYRPLGIQPGLAEDVVQTWRGYPGLAQDDAGRFEELDDDEDVGTGYGSQGLMDLEDGGQTSQLQDTDGDVAMDLD